MDSNTNDFTQTHVSSLSDTIILSTGFSTSPIDIPFLMEPFFISQYGVLPMPPSASGI